MKRMLAAAALALAALAGGCSGESGEPPVYGVDIVATMPHDRAAFTEGLFLRDGMLYESTGREGESAIRKVHLASGEELAREDLPPPYFGEGIVAFGDRLYQLTWQDQTGFIYRLDDLSQQGSFSYTGEGWGLTHDDHALIMSDGTATLRFLDPETLQETRRLDVTANGCPVRQLNELEWVDGMIYANIWQTDLIARIDPATGAVQSFLDIAALGPPRTGIDEVANGIAYDAAGKKLYVTGKYWPQLYEVREGRRVSGNAQAGALMACGG